MTANYGVPALEIVRGSGCRVWDADGNEYLDLVAGIATSALGHAHPAVVAAIGRQALQLIHTSNLYAHPLGLSLAERLISLTDRSGRVFFCQDGATANEAAIKLARLHAGRGAGRTGLVAMTGSFHGRTMGALSVTGSPAKADPFRPLLPDVQFVAFGDASQLSNVVDASTAAVFVEPVLGEGGVVVPSSDYLRQVRAICDEHGALMVVDEVQSGIGRTGNWFASLAQGVRPDVMTLAKGIAGGMPLGACVAFGDAATLFTPGSHGSTFGGNPVSCAAALAVIDEIEKQELLAHVRATADWFAAELRSSEIPQILDFSYAGLWFGITLDGSAARFEQLARSRGYLVNAVGPSRIRLAPPLNITKQELGEFLAALPGLCADLGQEHS